MVKRLTQVKGTNTLVDENNIKIEFLKKLEGRGQQAAAGFYKQQGTTEALLIKEDDPATCILEGSASYCRDLIPSALQASVNFASAGTKIVDNEEKAVSIQKLVISSNPPPSTVKPWDEIVYGRKRLPNTIISEEAWNSPLISKNIHQLSSNAQWQLAAAIYASTIVGDESLHVGQFMSEVTSNKQVTNLTRIDLGARERAAIARQAQTHNDPYKTSIYYQGYIDGSQIKRGGQLYKNYISYLLNDPDLKFKYTLMWLKDYKDKAINANHIKYKSKVKLIEQFSNIPQSEEQANSAIAGVIKTINYGCKDDDKYVLPTSISKEEKIERLADKISDLDRDRFSRMVAHAELAFSNQIAADLTNAKKTFEGKSKDNLALVLKAINMQSAFLIGKSITPNEKKDGYTSTTLSNMPKSQEYELIYEKLKRCLENQIAQENMDFEQIQEVSNTLINLSEVNNIISMKAQDYDNKSTHNLQLEKYYIIRECAVYSKKTGSSEKKEIVSALIKQVLDDDLESIQSTLEDKKIIKAMCSHTNAWTQNASAMLQYAKTFSAVSDSFSWIESMPEGHKLMDFLYHRYDKNTANLSMTMTGRQIHTYLETYEFGKISKMIENSQCGIDDFNQDQYGNIPLHYLMENIANSSVDDLIIKMLELYGVDNKHIINKPNQQGETPLHILMRHDNSQTYIDGLNQKIRDQSIIKSKGWTQNTYCTNITDFFDTGCKNNDKKTPLDIQREHNQKPRGGLRM